MSNTSDLYAQWLGIQHRQRPLNHYQILGLRMFEADVQVIERAFATQKARLVEHMTGEQVRHGKRLMMELESARMCLTQPQTKSAYDQSLRAAKEAQAPVPASPEMPEDLLPSSLPALDAFDPLNAQLAGLERVNSQFEQLSTTAVDQSAPTKTAAPPTMYSYNSPAPPKRQAVPKSSSTLLLGAGLGAAAVLVVVGLVVFFTRGTGAADDLSVAAIANAIDEKTANADAPEGPEIKPRNTRALMQKPVTAGSPKPATTSSSPTPPTAQSVDPKAPPPDSQPAATPRVRQPINQPLPTTARPAEDTADNEGEPSLPEGQTGQPAAPQTRKMKPRVSNPGSQQPAVVAPKAAAPTTVAPTWPELPLFVELPSLADSKSIETPVVLGKLEIPKSQRCQLTIVYGIEDETPSYQFKLQEIEGQPRTWSVAMWAKLESNSELAKEAEEPTQVAQFKVAAGELSFQWLPDCVRVPADKLRNAVIWVQVGDKKQRLQLRKPATPPALTLDLEDEVTNIPFSAAALPPLETLHLELLESQSLTLTRIMPPAQEVQGDEALRLVVSPGPPGVEVRLQLKLSGSKANVRIEPCIVDADGETMSFTNERMKTMQRQLPNEILETEDDLASAQKRRARIQGQIAAMGGIAGANGQAKIRLASLQQSLKKEEGSERTLNNRLTLLKRRLSVLPNLALLGNQIHNKSVLRLRVFFVSGGEEVDLLSM